MSDRTGISSVTMVSRDNLSTLEERPIPTISMVYHGSLSQCSGGAAVQWTSLSGADGDGDGRARQRARWRRRRALKGKKRITTSTCT